MDTSTITALTHDTSSAAFHIADFSSLLSHLTDAVAAAWPDRLTARYGKVKVLLMSWERDDLGVEAEIRPLEAVLRGLYHYDTEMWKIPSKRPAVELSRKIADLVDAYGREGNLLIFYYAGHARPSEQPGGGPVWAANWSRDSPAVQSSIIHSLLGEVDCDVLLLHDCCHSIQAGEAPAGKGTVETLAACGFESAAAEVGKASFTASLVQELAHAAHTTDWLSVVELHRRLINRLQAGTPSVSFNGDTYSLVQVDRHTGQSMFEGPRRPTPIYSFLSRKPRTIVLSPLSSRASKQPDEPFLLLNPPTSQSEAIPEGPGILVACRLRDRNVDVEKWKEWLLNAPPRAQNIQITAIYPSFSAVLVLELPLVVWDLLPASPAISFVAYTTGKNHVSDFRRLLDLEEEVTSVTSDDESGDERQYRASRKGADHGRRQRKGGNDHGRSSLWPKAFDRDRTTEYAMENEPYCLHLAEMQEDGNLSKAEKIVRAFVQDVDGPSTSYLCEEIVSFCSTASFEALADGPEVTPDLVAILDERSPPGFPLKRTHGVHFLNRNHLYEALSNGEKATPQLIATEPKPDQFSPRRRSIYVTNPDPASTLAIVSTASESQVPFLRDFVYKHLAFQAGMDVKIHSSGSPRFQLSFHLPYFAWRQSTKPPIDTRLGGDGEPLRSRRNISFLTRSDGKSEAYVHEAQISCMIVGVDNRHWTAYGFFDTYHDGGESKHDVRFYQPAQGEIIMDPLTGGRHAADTPVWTAREYFLRVMESCVQEVKEEWQNVGRNVLKALKYPTGNSWDVDWGRAPRDSHQTVLLLEQLMHGLSGTIAAWERFQENDLAYFDLDNHGPLDRTGGPRTSVMIKNIENDIRQLRTLEESLRRQTESFQGLTSRLLVLGNNRNGATINALVATGIAFLPFALMVLISNASDISAVQSTPARYVVASAGVACLAAAVWFAMVNWAAASEKVQALFAYFGSLQKARLVVPRDVVKRQMVGSAWNGQWWSSTTGGLGGPRYTRLAESESEADAAEGRHALPF